MRTAINALTEELRRLKGVGVKAVTVSDASLLALKQAMSPRHSSIAPQVGGARPPPLSTNLTVHAGVGGARPPGALADPGANSQPPSSSSAPGGRAPPNPVPPTVVLPASGSKLDRWTALKALVLADEVCQKNVRPGKKIVLGVGSLDARIMFVGEAPGAEEETQGEPFVGPAGQLLTKMIQAMGLQRSDVYIGNIMNWRPQMPTDPDGVQYGNRPPTGAELAYCLPYLIAQIDVVAPHYLVALGATASHGLLGEGAFKALGEVRGKWREYAGRPLMITYHPSYILRNPTNRSKRMIWDDLLQVMERAALPITDKQRGFFLDK